MLLRSRRIKRREGSLNPCVGAERRGIRTAEGAGGRPGARCKFSQ